MANLYKRYETVFGGAGTTNILTIPDATNAVVRSIIVANPTAGAIDVECTYSPSGTGTVYVVPSVEVAAASYVDLLSGKVAGPLILEQTDILKITSSAANLNVTVSALLIDRN